MNEKKNSDLFIVVISNFPPPIHGVSVFNEQLFSELKKDDNFGVRIFAIGSKKSISQIEKFSTRKALADFVTIATACFFSLFLRVLYTKKTILYFTPSQTGIGIYRDWVLTYFGKFFFTKIVGHLHGCRAHDTISKGGLSGRLLHNNLATCHILICLGVKYAALMKDRYEIDTVGINNGIDLKAYSDETRKSIVDPMKIKLLFLGALMESKGIWIAAATLQLLNSIQGIHATLTYAGTWFRSDEREKFESLYKDEIELGNIVFMGFADTSVKSSLMKNNDFLLLPILNPFEGQPIVLIEAMSTGLIPITTSNGAIPDLFDFTGGTKLAQNQHIDANAIVETLLFLCKDSIATSKLRKTMIAHCKVNFSMERVASQIKVEFSDVLLK